MRKGRWASSYITGSTSNGKQHNISIATAYGVSCGAGDVVGIAVDLTNGFIYISKNGTWMNSGDPTSGASGTGAMYGSLPGDTYYFAADVWAGGGISFNRVPVYAAPAGYSVR